MADRRLHWLIEVRYNVHMKNHLTATEARRDFFGVLKAAEQPGGSVTITHDGHPKVVMMPFEEFEGWQETLDILSDPGLVAEIQEGLRELKAGETVAFEEVKTRLNA